MLVPLSTATCVSAGLTAGAEDSPQCELVEAPVCVWCECAVVVEAAEVPVAFLLDPPPSELNDEHDYDHPNDHSPDDHGGRPGG